MSFVFSSKNDRGCTKTIPLRLVLEDPERVVRAWSRFGLHSGGLLGLTLIMGRAWERVRIRFCFHVWAI